MTLTGVQCTAQVLLLWAKLLGTSLAIVAGQPLLLVLNQLEERGLYLLHLGDLVEDQLAVLTRGLDGEPAAAKQPVDGPV